MKRTPTNWNTDTFVDLNCTSFFAFINKKNDSWYSLYLIYRNTDNIIKTVAISGLSDFYNRKFFDIRTYQKQYPTSYPNFKSFAVTVMYDGNNYKPSVSAYNMEYIPIN